ncbi:sensor histidine kinase [Massilia pinisoli]|uniref:histidine kinase n=1 Tax=Massilia pinisoli TaxID=1772194 RepID=A0ABT1ZNJ4_9BURK|nr:sensor histidine kinase [Massilia pinisoli]MCS0581482.1 sensor histidine kinase [Massilia pinisoli]
MQQYRLANFIRDNMEPILQEWEDFARTIEPPALTMDDEALRDHARLMLLAFSADLDSAQSDQERVTKSKGLGRRGHGDSAAETHAEARLLSGYTVAQLVSEYRALRSSVLALWGKTVEGNREGGMGDVMKDMMRFNEAVDQAVAESVARYEQLVKRSQNMFLAILGHDLRNPLGTLVSGSSFVMQAADIPPKYILAATRMFSSAKRMSKLVNDLIDFTRSHLGPGMPIRARQGSLVAVCGQVVDELRTFHPERRIEFQAPPELDAVFDDGRIAQMLSNLIGNAIQYGSADAPVKVSLSGNDDEIVVVINNQGPPVPPDKISSIFEPLVRVAANIHGDQAERTSLGIGLFISREIVLAHGGQISVASNAENGTTFTATIPRNPKKTRSTDVVANLPGRVAP